MGAIRPEFCASYRYRLWPLAATGRFQPFRVIVHRLRTPAHLTNGPLPLPPLPPQPRPVFEPLPDLALEAALDRLVEGVAADLLRPVVLAAESVGRVVVVSVVGA